MLPAEPDAVNDVTVVVMESGKTIELAASAVLDIPKNVFAPVIVKVLALP
jgi:aspartate ammonia-lyase